MRAGKVYLEQIIESMDYIADFVTGAEILNLEIIGDAVHNLSKMIRTFIPWREMAGLRDVLIHKYFGVDLLTNWE